MVGENFGGEDIRDSVEVGKGRLQQAGLGYKAGDQTGGLDLGE